MFRRAEAVAVPSAHDPGTLVGLLAAVVPARSAARLDPPR